MLVTQMKKHYANIDFLHVVQPEGAMGFSLPAAGREAVIRKIDTRVGGLTRQELKGDPLFVSRASFSRLTPPIVDSTGFLKRKME